MYETIHDLPFVCQLNLPEPALHVYRDAFNRAWERAADRSDRYAAAQNQAWSVVRERFERDRETGRWVPKATPMPRTAQTHGGAEKEKTARKASASELLSY